RVLHLPDGETLTVRKRLNHGERRDTFARMYREMPDGKRVVDPLKVASVTVLAYLLDWTLTDDAGNVVSLKGREIDEIESMLNSLDPDAFDVIRRAIEQHEQEMLAARQAGKQTDGEQTSQPISPSPDAAAGVTSGSGS